MLTSNAGTWHHHSMSQKSPAGARIDHGVFRAAAIGALLVVVVGFARTYFLRPWLELPPLAMFIHFHAAIMLAWIIVLVTQVFLIARKQLAWHRRLGWAGLTLAVLVLVMGTSATWRAAIREVSGHTEDASIQLTVLGLEMTQMALFAAFASLGFLWRRRPAYHKRMMIMATAVMLFNPIVRVLVALHIGSINNTTVIIVDALILAVVATDAARHRRLHPAFGWGAAAAIGGIQASLVFAPSAAWHAFATRLILA
jgi:hypothetical protein